MQNILFVFAAFIFFSKPLLAAEVTITDLYIGNDRVILTLDADQNVIATYCDSDNVCKIVGGAFPIEAYNDLLEYEPGYNGTGIGMAIGSAPIVLCMIRISKCGPVLAKIVPNATVRNNLLPVLMVQGNLIGAGAGYGLDYLIQSPSELSPSDQMYLSALTNLEKNNVSQLEMTVKSLPAFVNELSMMQMRISQAQRQ